MTRRELGALALGALLVPAAAAAQIGVTSPGNKHNLSATGPGPVKSSSETEICVFCHTPRNANPATPLWNHTLSTAASYQPYTSTTMKATVGLPTGSSKLCLACHDGTVAIGSTINNGRIAMQGVSAQGTLTGPSALGTDEGRHAAVGVGPREARERHHRLIAVRIGDRNLQFVGGWYLTGDLGFISDGELYVAGRKKDLIIVGGKNIYPQDIEALSYEVKGIHPGRSVAFGVFSEQQGTEEVCLVAETDTEDEAQLTRLANEVRQHVTRNSAIALRHVRVVGPKWILKTSSGKTARAANREKFLRELNGSTGMQG